jgi:hypothetical protein
MRTEGPFVTRRDESELKRGRHPGHSRPNGGGNSNGPLGVGRKVRDDSTNRTGTILDSACQFAHPKADPAYNYLVRWDDGQIQAISSAAFEGRSGLELVD